MSLQKNGTLRKAIAFGSALLTLSAAFSPLSAACDPYCPEPYCPAPIWDPCAWNMPDCVFYADFLYWQANPEGLEFARKGGLTDSPLSPLSGPGEILSPGCKMEPGFRLGVIIDTDCCDWDFYAQYTWLNQSFSRSETANPDANLQPLIANQLISADQVLVIDGNAVEMAPLDSASAQWRSTFNVLDFGMGRTFAVNNCFELRPHLGFKATWQTLRYSVTYTRPSQDVGEQLAIASQRVDMRNKTEFNGIGLRSGFDTAWRFSPCLSLVGGFAVSAVWSDIEVHREDWVQSPRGGDNPVTQTLNFKKKECALIPVTELLLGLRYDMTVCDYDIFVFLGWENQVWWNLSRFIVLDNVPALGAELSDPVATTKSHNGYDFGPQGNVAYQGLTLRAGMDF
jgi:hypothetical protein